MAKIEKINKVVRIGTGCTINTGNVYCKINYEDGKLSISGVEGPLSNGDAKGACGQIVMHEWDIREYAPGWDEKKVAEFRAVWDKWHLNDMRPNCQHQVGSDWENQKVNLYMWSLTDAARKIKKQAMKRAELAIKTGETFTPTAEETAITNLEDYVTNHSPVAAEHYEPSKSSTGSDYFAHVKTESTGWLSPEQHPKGFLGKPCPECGYKYGTRWLKEEVPEEVLEFLAALPDTDKRPAWV